MTTPTKRRLMRDFKRIQDDPPPGISAAPKDDDIMSWNAVIFGPPDTPYEDGTFHLTLQFSDEYPNRPPLVKFVSKMFHPNIYTDGSICLDILQSRWSPTYDVSAILTSIQSLLDEPNPNSPANASAAQLYSENRNEYIKRVASIVEQSWLESVDICNPDQCKPTSNTSNTTNTPETTTTTNINNQNDNNNIADNNQTDQHNDNQDNNQDHHHQDS